MLPTTGFFKDIDCPYYETTCGRPYCHFNHRKRSQEPPEEHLRATEGEAEIPTYKPTPKSELAGNRSHIPISYVPDLVVRSDRNLRPIPAFNLADRPTYKPTPISILSTTNVSKQCEYTPTNVSHSDDNDLDISALSHEFDMLDEILDDPEVCAEETTSSKKEDDKSGSSRKSKDKKKERSKTRDSDKKKESRKGEKESKGVKESSKGVKESSKGEKESSKGEKEDRHRKDKYSRSSKSKHRDKEKEKRSERKNKSAHKDKVKSKSSSSRRKEKKEREKSKEKSEEKKVAKSDDDYEVPPFDSDDDDLEESIEEECYKIFNEYKPPEVVPQKPVVEDVVHEEDSPPEEYVPTPKKRVAYEKAEQSGSKITYNKPKPIQNVALTLANRMKIAREAQVANEHRNLMMEINRQKRPSFEAEKVAPPTKVAKLDVRNGKAKAAPAKPASSLVDEIISGRSKPIRIAPVQNVNSIQMAKAKLDERLKAASAIKTPVQTMNKGTKRVAHVPDMSLTDIPDVLQADKSKLPVNVRTRYLTMLADECVKLYVSKDEAYQRAQQEELKCYERCKVLVTYRNSAMLAVNRLRKELQEREAAGLGPVLVGESTSKAQDSSLQGKRFYDSIAGYILTEDELVLHGYPREGAVPGRAIVNTEQRPVTSEHLDPNQRLCCRCRKVYLVDDDGYALIEEECMYHPLKKRTLRGERTYLCCKSLDDTGCVISNTHVSEESADRELEGYQSTMDPSGADDPRSHAVYALDCEMCYTTKGLELTRVTIVDTNLKTVYESLVKPLNPIIDYNTRFSGITKEQMDRTSTSILQVQANILHLCNNKTILIGHSLESDMKALKIIHDTVIDTSVMFPHKFGLPHKRALRVLASEYLKKIIQNDIAGHDSAEDALACMELVIWKAKEDMKVKR